MTQATRTPEADAALLRTLQRVLRSLPEGAAEEEVRAVGGGGGCVCPVRSRAPLPGSTLDLISCAREGLKDVIERRCCCD